MCMLVTLLQMSHLIGFSFVLVEYELSLKEIVVPPATQQIKLMCIHANLEIPHPSPVR